MPRASENPFKNVVLPDPRSPESKIVTGFTYSEFAKECPHKCVFCASLSQIMAS